MFLLYGELENNASCACNVTDAGIQVSFSRSGAFFNLLPQATQAVHFARCLALIRSDFVALVLPCSLALSLCYLCTHTLLVCPLDPSLPVTILLCFLCALTIRSYVTKSASQDAGGTTAAAHGRLAYLLMQGPAKRPVHHFQSEAHIPVCEFFF